MRNPTVLLLKSSPVPSSNEREPSEEVIEIFRQPFRSFKIRKLFFTFRPRFCPFSAEQLENGKFVELAEMTQDADKGIASCICVVHIY
jgi:hypothetical protein